LRLQCNLEPAQRLEAGLNFLLEDDQRRILNFDLDCANTWGLLMRFSNQQVVEKQIAAIALVHDLTVVTRNAKKIRKTRTTIGNCRL